MELLNQEFLEDIIKQNEAIKPIPFMARVKTELGLGFVVGYSDFSHIYKMEGCVLVSNFKYPEYYILLDKIILNPTTQENQRAHFFKKIDVHFIKTFNEWLEERDNKLKEYFDNIKMSRKDYQQKVMNKETTKINNKMLNEDEYKRDTGHSELISSEQDHSKTVQSLADEERTSDEINKEIIEGRRPFNTSFKNVKLVPLVEAIIKADELIKESIEIEVKPISKPKLNKKNAKRDYQEPGLFS